MAWGLVWGWVCFLVLDLFTSVYSKLKETLAAWFVDWFASHFGRIGQPAPPRIEFKSEGYLPSNSSTSALNQIMEALKSDGVNMIGVWGMGGVGKTTLVKEVGNKDESQQLFHKVIIATVSRTPSIENIQNKIADFIKLKFDATTIGGKAEELCSKLETEKVLIILDDLWEELKLGEIGIPIDGNRKGCKIILTTRRRQVCEVMASQVSVQLGALNEEEAWTLFKMKASLDNASPDPDIIRVAKKVAKECGGLPIAIVTLAKALRSRDLEGWKFARRKLKRSRLMDIEPVPKEVDQNAYLCLEMSYKYLAREPTKRCFLLCALYPEDYSIDVEDLVRHAWALRLYQEADSIKEVRSEVFEAINILRDSSLLSEGDNEKRYVKLHDVVRDVARWIASNQNNGLLAKSGVDSKNLQILLRAYDYDSKTPMEDFEGMPELKVLSLRRRASGSVFSFNAIKSLRNLRSLHLKGFNQLEGISALAKLTNLEMLCLHGSEFQESIDSIGELKKLKVLGIRRCKFLLGFPPNLIRRLVEVEELCLLYVSAIRRSMFEEMIAVILSELKFLPKLASLFLEVPSLHFPRDFVFPKLERYDILINFKAHEIDPKYFSTRSLKIAEGLPLNVISELLGNVEVLAVRSIMEKEIECLTDTTPGNVPVAAILKNLKSVTIRNCNNLQVIFSMKNAENHPSLLSKLKDLSLWRLPNLEYIWKKPTQHISLQSLEAVEISCCGKLRSLFSLSLARSLQCLEKLKISKCGELEQIVEQSEGDEQEISSNMSPDKSHLHPPCLPRLRTLRIYRCPRLEYVLPITLVQGLPKLEKLLIEWCDELRTLFTEQESDPESNNHLHPLGLPRLKTLVIHRCPRLEYVLPITLAQGLPQLEKLEIDDSYSRWQIEIIPRRTIGSYKREKKSISSQLKQVFGVAKQHDGVERWINLPRLKHWTLHELFGVAKQHGVERWINLPRLKDLTLHELTNLSSFGPENYFFKAPALAILSVAECPQLMKFTIQQEVNSRVDLEEVRLSTFKEILRNANNLTLDRIMDLQKNLIPDVDVDPQRLTSLNLYDCENLECLANTADEEHVPTSEVFTNLVELTMIKMNGLKVLWNGQPPRGFLQNLKSLTVGNCKKLEEIFGIDELLCNTEQNQAPLLANLDSLKIEKCKKLRWIVKGPTQYVSLRSLRDVSIEKCNKLESLFSSSLIPSLSLLEQLRIHQCDELKTVFAEDETKSNTLCVPNLKTLEITYCPTLKYVAPAIYFMKAPALEELQVISCPQLSNFSIQQDELLQHSKHFEECTDDANSCNSHLREGSPNIMNFEQLFHLPGGCYLTLSLETVELLGVNWLRYIWKGPIQVVQFLLQLRFLKIRACENLEQIIVNDATSASSSQGQEEDGTEVKSEKKMLMFPRLERLYLQNLPSLVSFSPVGYRLVFPSLDKLIIEDCCQLITIFTVDSTLPIHAETKATGLDDASSSKRDIRWRYVGEREALLSPPVKEEVASLPSSVEEEVASLPPDVDPYVEEEVASLPPYVED